MKNKLIKLSLYLILPTIMTFKTEASTITSSTQRTIYDSYSKTNTIYIDVPYAESIGLVTVDNGYVQSQTFDKSTGKVKVVVTGGYTHEIDNPYKYSTNYSTTETADSLASLPRWIDVTDGDYSGTVYLYDNEPVLKSKQVSGLATHVQDYYWECTDPGKLIPNPDFDDSKADNNSNPRYFYEAGSWAGPILNTVEYGAGTNSSGWHLDWDLEGITGASYSDSSGYSCEGSASVNSVSESNLRPVYVPTAGNDWDEAWVGKRDNAKYRYTYYSLSGTATKTTYKGLYSGTLYMAGTDDVYTYKVTVNYNKDVLDINYYLSTNQWTNSDVNITISSGSTFFDKFKVLGSYSYSKPTTFKVSSNGTYSVIVYDNYHGQSVRTITKNITVSNIDKLLPLGSFSPSSQLNWSNPINVTFNPTDSGGSGVAYWSYSTSKDNGKSYTTYSSNLTGSKTINLTDDGINKIKVKVTDNAGNVNIVYSNLYYIDTTPPDNVTFTPNDCYWRNNNIIVKWTGTDAASGIKDYRYRIYTVNNEKINTTAWSNYSNLNTITTVNAEGLNYIEVEARDQLNNSKIFTSEAFKIDYTKPSVDLEIEDFIKDIFIDIPIRLVNIKDNLSGVNKIEVSLYKDFNTKIEYTIKDESFCNLYLPRNGLSLDQTIYIKIYDIAGNIYQTQKDVYLDPLPPNTPNILNPIDNTLLVNSEPISIEWNYSDPGQFPLEKSIITFVNRENNETYKYNLNNDNLKKTIYQSLPQGGYDMYVTVYNTMGKKKDSEPLFIRKNFFKIDGSLITKDISAGDSKFSFVDIDIDYTDQKITEKIKSSIQIDILMPDEKGVFNVKNTKNIYNYDLTKSNKIMKLDKSTNKIKVIITLKNTDEEYSTISSWLDNIKVSVK